MTSLLAVARVYKHVEREERGTDSRQFGRNISSFLNACLLDLTLTNVGLLYCNLNNLVFNLTFRLLMSTIVDVPHR